MPWWTNPTRTRGSKIGSATDDSLGNSEFEGYISSAQCHICHCSAVNKNYIVTLQNLQKLGGSAKSVRRTFKMLCRIVGFQLMIGRWIPQLAKHKYCCSTTIIVTIIVLSLWTFTRWPPSYMVTSDEIDHMHIAPHSTLALPPTLFLCLHWHPLVSNHYPGYIFW